MSVWSTTSLSGGYPFAQLRVLQEDMDLCPFDQVRVYQVYVN